MARCTHQVIKVIPVYRRWLCFCTDSYAAAAHRFLFTWKKRSDCHEMKSKHLYWTQGLKCDHRVWHWPWPWPSIFKVKYGICYISAKSGLIATKRKANITIELRASNVTTSCDLGHDLVLQFSKSNLEFAISQPKVVRLPRNEKQTYPLNSRLQMWPVGLTLTMTLTFEFEGQIWPWPLTTHMTLTMDFHSWTLDVRGMSVADEFLFSSNVVHSNFGISFPELEAPENPVELSETIVKFYLRAFLLLLTPGHLTSPTSQLFFSTACLSQQQRKYQSFASLLCTRGL